MAIGDFDYDQQVDYSKLNIPEFGDIPQYAPPRVDDRRVDDLTQTIAAPRLRKARRGLRETLTRTSDNPAVDAMNKRAALEGFGQSLEGITSAASGAALQRYQPEFQAEQEALRFTAEKGFQKQLSEFRAKLEASRNVKREDDTVDRPRHITYQQSTSPLSSLGLNRFKSTSNYSPRESTSRSSGQPVVNSKFWKGGYNQQQQAVGLSDRYNIPLESFYGSSNPQAVAYNYTLDNEEA